MVTSVNSYSLEDVDSFYSTLFDPRDPTETSERNATLAELSGSLDELIGIDKRLESNIRTALATKRHVILYGPPGTGKTTIARMVAESIADDWVILTGTSDWTAHEVIGGYMPKGDGTLRFEPGLVLSNFEKVTIIDEFNRADIDKAFGPLFSILSDQPVVLPFRVDPSLPDSPRIEVLPEPGSAVEDYQYAPGPAWRLICTLNSYDKSALFQMSYALARRFAWVYVDVPRDTSSFVIEFAGRRGWDDLFFSNAGDEPPLVAKIWQAVNDIRMIGPAPIIDTMEFFALASESPELLEDDDRVILLLQSLATFIVPQLEGITEEESAALTSQLAEIVLTPDASQDLLDLFRVVEKQLATSAI